MVPGLGPVRENPTTMSPQTIMSYWSKRSIRRLRESRKRVLARRKGRARRAWVGQVVEIGLPVALFMGMILLILLFYPRVVSASAF